MNTRGEDEIQGGQLASPRGSKVSADELLREVEEYFALGATVCPGDTVIDVGANVGAFSLRVAEKCRGDVSLVCFEPSPLTYQALQINFATHSLLKKTSHSIHSIGLSSKDMAGQVLSFFNFRRFPTNSTFDLANKRREFEIFFEDRGRRIRDKLENTLPSPFSRMIGPPVDRIVSSLPKGSFAWWVSKQVMGLEEVKAPIETLDDMIQRGEIKRVDLLKIDVEGPELEVLRGLGPKSWPLVKQVVMETHNRDGRLKEIEAILRTNGLTRIETALQKTVDNGLDSILLLATRQTQ